MSAYVALTLTNYIFNTNQKVIAATFERRQTPLPDQILVGLTESYATEKAQQWNAFLKRSQLDPPSLDEMIKELAAIYWPLLEKSSFELKRKI